MSSTGAGYDLSAGTFSPDGRLFQVEYAKKAVENSGTAIAVHCKDGIVLAVEKLLISKMLIPGTNQRIHNVDRHIGMAVAGLAADGRQLVNRAREEAQNYKDNYGGPIPVNVLSDRLGQYVHYFTLHGSLRPFGTSVLLCGYDEPEEKTNLSMIEPSGVTFQFRGCAIGKGQQASKTEIEKYRVFEMTCSEAVKYMAKIIYLLHDDVKDKPLELEMSWICEASKWQHQRVPEEVRSEAIEWAKKSIEDDDMEDDDDE